MLQKVSTLSKRTITGLALITVVLGVLLYLPPLTFMAVSAGIFLWAGYEYTRLLHMGQTQTSLYLAVLAGASLLVMARYPSALLFLWTSYLWCAVAIFLLICSVKHQLPKLPIAYTTAFGVVAIVPSFLALNWLRGHSFGTFWIVFLFLLVWGADIGAYFGGKYFGHGKLAPVISPNKTRAGLLSAFMVNACIMGGAIWFYRMPFYPLFLVTLFTTIAAVVGDLAESALKRMLGAKDSGHSLPGHGGWLDRMDSLFAAAPVFVAALVGTGWVS